MATSSTASGLTKTKLKATLTQLKKAAEAAPDALTDEHQRRELMEATMKLMQALQRPEDLIINVAFAVSLTLALHENACLTATNSLATACALVWPLTWTCLDSSSSRKGQSRQTIWPKLAAPIGHLSVYFALLN